jgi:hypothetical protein
MQSIYIQVFNQFGTLLELDFNRMCNMCALMYHQNYLLHEWLHTPQVNGCFQLCVHWCTFITLKGERPFTCGFNILPFTGKQTPSTTCMLLLEWLHTPHVNRYCPLCVHWFTHKWLGCVNDLLHTSQVCAFLPPCHYSAACMICCIRDLDMDDPHHVWAYVHMKFSVYKRKCITLKFQWGY